MWRCALRAHGPWAGRPLFVVGRGRAGTDAHDLLRVDVEEGRCGGRSSASGRGGVCSQSVTGIVKLAALLRYAARQPERWVARCDDDTFVSLPALELHAARLPAAQRVVAGNFEWYNFIPNRFKSVGWGYGPRNAMRNARAYNCSVDGSTRDPFHGDPCWGPINFPKGPLVLMSRSAVRDIVDSGTSSFEADLTRLAAVEAKFGARRYFSTDVLLGWWLSRVRELAYVELATWWVWREAEGGDAANYWLPGDAPRRYPTAQATTRAVDASRILALHKFPWRCWPALGAMVGGLTVRVTPQRVDCHRPARLRGCSQRRLCAHTDPQYSCAFPDPPAVGEPTTLCCPHAFNATVDVGDCRDYFS